MTITDGAFSVEIPFDQDAINQSPAVDDCPTTA